MTRPESFEDAGEPLDAQLIEVRPPDPETLRLLHARAAQQNREDQQRFITRFVLYAIVAEAVVAAVAVIAGAQWQDVKDVLSYCLAPLTALAGLVGAFYFGNLSDKP
jgi:hypothetical protein